MRLSCIKTDPGYRADTRGVKVYLDGHEIKDVVTADEEEGFVIVYARDERGRVYLNEHRTEAMKKTLWGRVYIEGAHAAQAAPVPRRAKRARQ